MKVASGAIGDSMDEWLCSENFKLLGYFVAQVWPLGHRGDEHHLGCKQHIANGFRWC